jgi:hypothetical protein
MQTQALADFCIACLEEALVIYAMERLISACGNGLMTYLNPSLPTTPSPREFEGLFVFIYISYIDTNVYIFIYSHVFIYILNIIFVRPYILQGNLEVFIYINTYFIY